jgi:hypothetical protein
MLSAHVTRFCGRTSIYTHVISSASKWEEVDGDEMVAQREGRDNDDFGKSLNWNGSFVITAKYHREISTAVYCTQELFYTSEIYFVVYNIATTIMIKSPHYWAGPTLRDQKIQQTHHWGHSLVYGHANLEYIVWLKKTVPVVFNSQG